MKNLRRKKVFISYINIRKLRRVILSLIALLIIVELLIAQSNWIIQEVDTGVGRCFDLALDTNDYPHISYYDFNNKDLKYAYWDGEQWIIQQVDTAGDVGISNSIAINKSGYPCIAYEDREKSSVLKYAQWNGNEWIIQTIDTSAGTPDLTLDKDGYPCICYFAGGLKYVKLDSTGMVFGIIDTQRYIRDFSSIINDSGYLVVAYIVNYDVWYYDVWYAEETSTGWTFEVIDTVPPGAGLGSEISLDWENNAPHITYRRGPLISVGPVVYVTKRAGNWIIETINGENAPTDVSIAVKDSFPCITYVDWYGVLKYARKTSLGWKIETISNSGRRPCIKLTQKGYPCIVYGEHIINIYKCILKYAYMTQGIEEKTNKWSKTYELLEIFPKFFGKGGIEIKYQLDEGAYVSLTIYDITGSKIRLLKDEYHHPGTYWIYWDGKGDRGNRVSSGVYFVKVKLDNKMIGCKKIIKIG